MTISIAKDYSRTPGFRFITDGPYSGEVFRKKFLEPHFTNPENTEKVTIDLDGVAGYATSFLEEAFGGLARLFGVEITLKRLEFISDEEPMLIDEITSYIKNCNEKQKK
jgi:hypothetical protein